MAATDTPAFAEIVERIPFCDTDCGGVVSNIAYLRYVEKARIELFDVLGMPAAAMMGTGLFPAVVRTEIDYRAPARLGEELRVEAWLESVEKARVACAYALVVSAPGTEPRTVARARQTVALVQMPEGRPRRIPPEWAERVVRSGA